MTGPLTCPSCGAPPAAGARFCRSCGTDLATAAAVPAPGPGGDQPTPAALVPVRPITVPAHKRLAAVAWGWLRRRARSRRVRIGTAVAVLVSTLLYVGLVYGLAARNPPEDQVRELFAALSAHDGKKAWSLVPCETKSLCTDRALATGYTAPDHVEIVKTEYGLPDKVTRRPDRNRATVRVRYRLGGATFDDRVILYRNGSGLVRKWHIEDPPGGTVDVVSDTIASAQLGGAKVSTIDSSAATWHKTGDLQVLPGEYTLWATESALVAAVPTTVKVTGSSGYQQLAVDVTIKPDVVTEVTRQVRDLIDRCAAKADLVPDVDDGPLSGCPFRSYPRYTITKDPKWTVVDYPTIKLVKKDDGSVTVKTTTAGHARVDVQVSTDILEPRKWSAWSETVEVKVSGTVTASGNTVTWSP